MLSSTVNCATTRISLYRISPHTNWSITMHRALRTLSSRHRRCQQPLRPGRQPEHRHCLPPLARWNSTVAAAPAITAAEEGVTAITTLADAQRVLDIIAKLSPDTYHAWDTEVTDIDLANESPVGHGRVICASFYCGPSIDFGTGPRVWIDNLDAAEGVLLAFKPLLESSTIRKVWHNYGFDRHVLFNHGIDASGLAGDTMHMGRLWNSALKTRGGYSLENLADMLCGMQKTPMKELFAKPRPKQDGSPSKVLVLPPLEEVQRDPQARDAWIAYSARDAACTWHLRESLEAGLRERHWVSGQSMWDFYLQFLVPFAEVLTDLERAGIYVDVKEQLPAAERLAFEDRARAEALFIDWVSQFCPDAKLMNVGSDVQKAHLLFAPCTRQRPTGAIASRNRSAGIAAAAASVAAAAKAAAAAAVLMPSDSPAVAPVLFAAPSSASASPEAASSAKKAGRPRKKASAAADASSSTTTTASSSSVCLSPPPSSKAPSPPAVFADDALAHHPLLSQAVSGTSHPINATSHAVSGVTSPPRQRTTPHPLPHGASALSPPSALSAAAAFSTSSSSYSSPRRAFFSLGSAQLAHFFPHRRAFFSFGSAQLAHLSQPRPSPDAKGGGGGGSSAAPQQQTHAPLSSTAPPALAPWRSSWSGAAAGGRRGPPLAAATADSSEDSDDLRAAARGRLSDSDDSDGGEGTIYYDVDSEAEELEYIPPATRTNSISSPPPSRGATLRRVLTPLPPDTQPPPSSIALPPPTTGQSRDASSWPAVRTFKVDNTEGYIEPGAKPGSPPKRQRSISLVGLGLPPVARTVSGWPAVSSPVLKLLAGKTTGSSPAYGRAYEAFGGGPEGVRACEALAALYTVSTIDTMLSNFIVPLQTMADAGSRVHCSLNLNTETGRLSARRPNLQNQPALEKDRYGIRRAFRAAPGCKLIAADYGQLELRLLAHMTKCASMISAFGAGGDFHSRTAAGMYPHVAADVASGAVLMEWDEAAEGRPPPAPLLKSVYANERRKAKVLNFSIAYGKTAMGLSKDWGVTPAEAKETLEAWYADRPEVREWQSAVLESARATRSTRTLLGRYRDLPDIVSRDLWARRHAERAAINTPIQGGAADVAMAAMLKLARNESLRALGWRMLLQIHDEVLLEGPVGTSEAALALVKADMEAPFPAPLLVDLIVDAVCVDTWFDAK